MAAAAAPKAADEVPADREVQLLVLGAGPGGYTAAFRAADLGLKVTLIERWETLGGVCLNVGCIPSKALLHAAKVIDEAAEMGANGVNFAAPQIDLPKLRAWKSKVVGRLTGGLTALANVGPQNPREFREVASTGEKLRPLAEATGGTVRRLAPGGGEAIALPRLVEMRESSLYGGADWIGVKHGAATALKGVRTTPLALGLSALCALLGAAILVWTLEGRR